jgi:hypothetical protein
MPVLVIASHGDGDISSSPWLAHASVTPTPMRRRSPFVRVLELRPS